jgi:DNA-binding transcriptional ArsR family regulator
MQTKARHYEWFFETLANPLRMRIILMLLQKPYSVNEIVDETKEEQSKISHAIKILALCRLLQMKKQGRQHIYQTDKKRVLPLLKLVEKCICTGCTIACRQEMRKSRKKEPTSA